MIKTQAVCQFCEKPFDGVKLVCVKCRRAYCGRCRENLENPLPWCKLCQGEKVLSDQERRVMDKQTLYCREGGSDKQYTIWIEEDASTTKPDRFMVQAQWGRRGGTVQSGAKTPAPVTIGEAQEVMDKVLREKKAKGYHEGEDAPAFKQVLGAVDSGLSRPMLLADATDAGEASYVENPEWGAQEKINGKRILVRALEGQVVGSNRRGLVCPIPQAVVDALKGEAAELDGEMVGVVYHGFDMVAGGCSSGGPLKDYQRMPLATRFEFAEDLVKDLESKNVVLVPLVVGQKEKLALFEKLKAGRREGIVFKRLDAPYVPGKVENLKKATAVKVKFYSEGTFKILRWNDRSSIQVAAVEVRACPSMVPVGNVTVPEKHVVEVNAAIASGHLVRVRYLYATPNRVLYQPTLDPDGSGRVTRDDAKVTRLVDLKLEGKDE